MQYLCIIEFYWLKYCVKLTTYNVDVVTKGYILKTQATILNS